MKSLTLEMNGVKVSHHVEPRETLADFLRERCRLTATHLGCEHGACGACTVVVDGKAARSCLRLAIMCDELTVQTLEGMEQDAVMDVAEAALSSWPRAAMRFLYARHAADGTRYLASHIRTQCRDRQAAA